MLVELLSQWQEDSGNRRLPVAQLVDYLYDALAEQRREQRVGQGVLLATVHAAKGTEFDHVLVPHTGWTIASDPSSQEEERRLFYVAMTRARHTLTLMDAPDHRNPHVLALDGDYLLRRPATAADVPPEVLKRKYALLGMEDVDLGFAGAREADDPIHTALARLQTGQQLRLVAHGDQINLLNERGMRIARLSRAAVQCWKDRLGDIETAQVAAIVRRQRNDATPQYRDRCRCDRWEVPLIEVVYRKKQNIQPPIPR